MGHVTECKLLSGLHAALAQAVLGLLAISALVYKRLTEKPQRPWGMWGMDVSKQLLSSLAAHFCGMLIAVIAAQTEQGISECAWYFVAFSFDTTVGVAITVGLHNSILKIARRKQHQRIYKSPFLDSLIQCGYYGTPPSYNRWAIQLTEWTICVVLARACVGALVVLLHGVLGDVAAVLDYGFEGHPTMLLFFVMVACPLCMNTAQLLIQDFVLKWRKGTTEGTTTARSTDSAWDFPHSEDEGENAQLLVQQPTRPISAMMQHTTGKA